MEQKSTVQASYLATKLSNPTKVEIIKNKNITHMNLTAIWDPQPHCGAVLRTYLVPHTSCPNTSNAQKVTL